MKRLPIAISKEEFIELIKNTKRTHHKLAFLLGFGAGLRISEVLKLEQRDINLKEKNIFIRSGKGDKDRIVPLPKGFKDIMVSLLPFKIGERAIQKAIKRIAQKAGILKNKPEFHFHSLRHGFASHLAKMGVPIHHIRTLLGHANISTTNVYLELNPKEAIKVYEGLF